ncbi:dynein heavy chain 7, axonemal-like, partial [Chelonus insularis]|uniref:dynein heavy chain 7, axonemal-like n=1 Tax=Chelonus insularis TaxID=460826 RepID=UPI00158C43A9
CLENLFTQQILSVMMQTIDNIIDTLKNSECRPQLNFQLVFENNCLVIEPSIDQIINFYNEIMIDIENIAQNYEQIEVFNSYLEKVYSMENYMYYNVGVLNQITAKEKLKNIINEIKGILINKLEMYHFNYNQEICQEFEDLKSKALNIPNNTKDLFELSEQMALASTITIEKLENKIRESIEMLSALMQITPITEEHIELNKNTINWLTLIQDIFNQSNSLCEGMKSELEDELQKKINLLNTQVDIVVPSLIILDAMDDAQRAHEYIEYLDILVKKIQAIDKQVEEINLDEKLFKFPETQFPKIQEIKDIILPFYDLIIMINEWTRYSSIWMDGPYEYIDSNYVEKTTNYYFEKFSDLNQLLKKKIKADSQSINKLFKFSGIIDDPDPMQQSAPLKLCYQVLEQVKQFNQYIPLINCMCNKALARRHWNEMSIIYGNDLTPNAGTTLRKIIALDLMKDIDKYQVISISANKELLLQQQLEMMNMEWNDINFTIENDCTKDNKFLFVQFPKIQLLLEHHLVLTEEMISSYFVKPIITEVKNFRESLHQVRDIVQKWNYIQDECVFFKQIFINNQSSTSTKDFEELSIFKYALSYLEQLTDISATIEHITIGINNYLEYVRSNFPRFYFLSNIEIIEILFNQADTVTRVKKLLQKCFCGINNIQLNSKNEVMSIISDYNEILTLTNNTICLKSLQNNNTWLTFIESIIIMSVRNKIGSNCINLNINIDNLVDEISKLIKNTHSLALITECTLKLFWTSSIQQCLIQFHTSKFKLLLNEHNQFINNLIVELKEISPRCHRIILMSHVVFSINQQEIISQLVNKNVQHENDFYWIVQLRYYFQDDNNVQVYMLNSIKNYEYEFMSTGESFINTPLTDRCYRILFEGANNNFFGALIGSTGIGKIETIKSLSRALAVKLYPIHCTQYISYQYITQIFKGFMAYSFWICFKNINNLPLNILSLLINNIYTISQILCSTATKIITFEGLTKLPINKSSGFIAVTVNLGVSTSLKQLSINNYLTDNFNAIFRVIAYTNSDINQICEIKLFASGFINSKSLSNKIVDIYKFISSHQFSSNFKIPYNVEYQSINMIIKTAINLKFKFSYLDDEMIIVRSLMDIYLPCFPNDKVIIFQELLESYFPQIIQSTSSLLTNNYTTLLKVLEQIMEKNNLEFHELFKLKIIQLFEMIFIKNGLIILGESLSGKTTIIETFIKCLSILNNNDNDNNNEDNLYWINQNCMTIENILGYFNVKLEKWYDGVFTSILRDANNYSNVQISIMFETDNLNNASPSTISRCGIIYVDSFDTKGWRFYTRIWIKNQKFDVEKKYYEFLSSMLEWSLDACLNFINQKCTLVAAVSDSYLVISTLKLFDIHLKDAFSDGSIEIKEKLQYFGLWCQAALILAIIWAIGGCLTVDHQSIFNEFCLSLWNNEIEDHQRPEILKICDIIPLPTDGTIHDNIFIFKAAGSWKHWSDILKSNYSMDIEICDDFNNLIVPTTDSIKYIDLFLKHIKYRVPFIINGESSIGKTSCIRYLLKKKLPNTKNLAYMYRFTQTTSVSQLRHFNFYTMFTPNKDNLLRIFSNILLFNLKRNQFSNDIIGSINSIVNSIIHVYINMKNFFHPTPTQIFYQFDIADIARVINGCSLIHRESVETKITLIRLWIHESLRVFGDRITIPTDYDFLLKKIEEAVGIYFKDTFDSIFDHLPKYNGKLTRQSFSNLMFTNFSVDNTNTICKYEEINSKDALKNKLIACLNEFNRLNVRKIDIVILTNIVEHLIRICRVLTLPGGQLILFCTGGTGRRSLARLAAFIQKQKFFQLSTTSTISNKNDSDNNILLNEWRDNLKSILKICGGYNQDCTYFIPGRYIQDTYFDDINSLLTTGEILDLFRADEKREIIEISRLLAQKGDRNLELKTSQIMDYFFNQCKLKLHFILYFNVYDNNKRTLNKLKLWKNLIKYCFIDCYINWPPEAFTELGNYLLVFDDHVHIDRSTKEKVITACKYLYDKSEKLQMDYYKKFNRIIHVYNPSAFIYMIKLFCQLLNKKQAEIIDLQNKYLCGLNKLLLASEQVNKMKTILTSLRPQLEESVKKMQNTMREIENENITVETTTIQVKRDEEVANRKAKIASTLKSECEADLAVAIPILEDAIAALNTLKPTDITLVKAMKNPPDTVKLVMAAVCVMLGVPAEKVIDPITGRKSMDFWGPSKRILSDMNFLQNLKDYDKDNIPSGIMQVIKKTYMVDKSFMPHIVAKASSAAEGLCKWVRAMVSYDEVVKVVAPKKEKLAGAEKEYNETIAFLNNKRKILSALNDKLTTLNNNLKLTVINKMELESEITKCTERLVKAEKLIKSLGGEKQKWTESVDSLKTSHKNLVGDLIISCAIVIYLSPCHLAFRDINIEQWKDFLLNLGISYSTDFNFVNVIKAGGTTVNPSNYRHFENNRFYTENALIYYYSQKYCLFIDPENQANLWIKDIELKNDLKIVQVNSNNCLEDIKTCMRNGQPVLIENNIQQHYFSLPLEFIFTRSHIYSMNNKQYLYINKEVIEYHPNFRLYITTRFDNPIYESYIFEKMTIINFLLPTQVIYNKLLDIIVSRECPEYQEVYDNLLIQNIDNKQVLKQEENNILSILSTSTVNILEDENSIKLLDSTKILFYDLQRKDKEIKIEIDKINLFRNNYNELAQYCANLFNTLTILTHLNCMYKFSYRWFLQLYIKSISNSNTSVKLDKRLNYLKLSFTKILHCNIVNGLYEKHKLLYTFLLCLKLSINKNDITNEEYQYFIENCITSTTQINIECHNEEEQLQDDNWITEKIWMQISTLSKSIEAFQGLEQSIKNDDQLLWKDYYNAKTPENHCLPEPWEHKLTSFQKLILVSIIRPDRMLMKVLKFISTVTIDNTNLLDYLDLPLNLSYMYSQSNCSTPLLFILPSYIDLSKLLEKFASKLGYSSKFNIISSSYFNLNHQNYSHELRRIISDSKKDGKWLFIQDCHLAIPELSKELESINNHSANSNINIEFRLWLSSCPTDQFPINILQDSIKLTYNKPKTVKKSLIHSYNTEPINSYDFFNNCSGKNKIFSRLLFSLSFFHAIIGERNYFNDSSWNVKHDFSHYDLVISAKQLKTLLLLLNDSNNSNQVSYEALTYFIGDCNYGGRIIDATDRRCSISILQDYFNEKYIVNINRRYKFLNDWIQYLDSDDDQRVLNIWLGGLEFPHRLFIIAPIFFSKQYDVAVDQIQSNFVVMPTYNDSDLSACNVDNSHARSMYFNDLYLSGAKWDLINQKLISNNSKIQFNKMPIVQYSATVYDPFLDKKQSNHNCYICPLYKSTVEYYTTSNFITGIKLPTNISYAHFLKNGTRLFCLVE